MLLKLQKGHACMPMQMHAILTITIPNNQPNNNNNKQTTNMRLTLLLLTIAAVFQQARAQSTATVLVQDSTYYGSYNAYMSTSFVGLKLPSGSGTHVTITIQGGDYADYSYVTSYSDHTQDGPYYIGTTTSFTIGATGKYWLYLSGQGTNNNVDYLEIRVEDSTWQGAVPCYYCNPPYDWGSGWPPTGTHLVVEGPPVLPKSQPVTTNTSYTRVPNWAIVVLAVVIALAVFVPASYFIYRRVQKNKAAPAPSTETTETTPQVEVPATAV
jgi:hypothetical protein